MKTFKFRGKSKKDGTWAYGDYVVAQVRHIKTWVKRPYILHIYGNGGMLYVCGRTLVLEDTVGQYTGINDNNGREIYEGDIIRFKYEDYSEYNINGYHAPREVISEVKFEYGEYRLNGYPCRLGDCLDWADDECEFEVIGNIYDNPELINHSTTQDQ